MTALSLLDRPNDYWIVRTVTDEIVTENGCRVHVDHLHRVLAARRIADLRKATATATIRREAE